MERRIVIFDRQSRFVKGLADYLNKKYTDYFETMAFDDAEKLLGFLERNTCRICFVSRSGLDAYQTEKIIQSEIPIVYISNDKRQEGIYQFQSVEKIAKDIIEQYIERFSDADLSSGNKKRDKKHRWIGFYSPCRCYLQSSIALAMGQILGEGKNVLYINFEAFSGLSYILQKEFNQDLADLIFYLKEDETKMQLRMQSMLHQVGKLYYLPPVSSFLDLQDVSSENWKQFFTYITEQVDMDVIILDLSELVNGFVDMLSVCDEIYTCYDENDVSYGKLQQYKHFLACMQKQDILDKTKEYRIPQIQNIPKQANMFVSGSLKNIVKAIMEDKQE